MTTHTLTLRAVMLVCALAALVALAEPRGKVRSASAGDGAASTSKVALVIGNAAYQSAPLTNPINDARDMAAMLKVLGFEVLKYENLRVDQLGSVLSEFSSRLQPGAVALFFYAGHGLQVKGVNYLPAVDSKIKSELHVPLQSLDVNQILGVMEDAKTRLNLVFLDACRNNPLTRSFRSANEGLAKVNAPSGTLISFATRPGSVASDGDERNGLYTKYLLQAMDVPNQPVEQMLKQVLSSVKRISRGDQEPWFEGSIEGDFYFKGGASSVNEEVEKTWWGSIQDSVDIASFNAYLTQYPTGLFVRQAKAAIARLERLQTPESKNKTQTTMDKKIQEELKKLADENKRLIAESEQRLVREEESRRQLEDSRRKLKEQKAQQDSQNAASVIPVPAQKPIYVPGSF